VVKTEADNLFATFDTVPMAFAAAVAILESLSLANAILPEDWDVHVGIGIGFGKLLVIGHEDVYGSEMNLASKLGEDLAEARSCCGRRPPGASFDRPAGSSSSAAPSWSSPSMPPGARPAEHRLASLARELLWSRGCAARQLVVLEARGRRWREQVEGSPRAVKGPVPHRAP
jgi:hypothetical protein